MKNKLNIIKGEAKVQSRKYAEIKKEFESLDEISKECGVDLDEVPDLD